MAAECILEALGYRYTDSVERTARALIGAGFIYSLAKAPK